MMNICKLLMICLLSFFLWACASDRTPHTIPANPPPPSTRITSELQQGQRYFEEGYYKRAMKILLPLACDGNADAQYAVGYMYYYGLGVAQDTDVGYFWIQRSAHQHHLAAMNALDMINSHQAVKPKLPKQQK